MQLGFWLEKSKVGTVETSATLVVTGALLVTKKRT